MLLVADPKPSRSAADRHAYYVAHREEHAAYQRVYRAANAETAREYNRAYRGTAAAKEYRDDHREELAECQRRYYTANRERILGRVKARREAKPEVDREWREANKEHLAAYARERYLADSDKWREYARQYRTTNPDYLQQWRDAHPGAARAQWIRRRAVKRQAEGVATVAGIAARWAMYGDKCWICGGVATATDHVKPLAKGGSNWPSNLRPICLTCNSSKGATWPLRRAA